jgi:hypothetical protein
MPESRATPAVKVRDALSRDERAIERLKPGIGVGSVWNLMPYEHYSNNERK